MLGCMNSDAVALIFVDEMVSVVATATDAFVCCRIPTRVVLSLSPRLLFVGFRNGWLGQALDNANVPASLELQGSS